MTAQIYEKLIKDGEETWMPLVFHFHTVIQESWRKTKTGGRFTVMSSIPEIDLKQPRPLHYMFAHYALRNEAFLDSL